MTAATKRTYKATFILDTRGREESVDQLVADVAKEIATLDIEVLKTDNLGRRDFARVTDPKLPAGNYVQFELAGPAKTDDLLREHFRLNPAVYRILLQSA